MDGGAIAGAFTGLANALVTLFIICLLCVPTCIWLGYDKWIKRSHSIESHIIVKPEIKLHTDGKTIDTIFVYNFKK